MSPMLRFLWLAAIIAALAITSAAQQPNNGKGDKTALKNGDKCNDNGGCTCVTVNVPVGCTCEISEGTGTAHCAVSSGGGLGLLGSGLLDSILLIFVGALIGSGLTYLVMRGRVRSP